LAIACSLNRLRLKLRINARRCNRAVTDRAIGYTVYMSPWTRLGCTLCASLFLVAAAGAAVPGTDLRVLDARTPATGNDSALVYLSVHNTGGYSDRLEGASTAAAARVVFEKLTGSTAAPQLARVAGVDLPIGGSIDFTSSGLQMKLVGLRRPLVSGQHFALKLKFHQAGALTTTVQVVAAESQHRP
jgi:copper(I)-binding protein